MEKKRLDALLVERAICESREKAKAMILAGDVTVDGAVVDRASSLISVKAEIGLRRAPPYVSRGGVKLEHALRAFRLAVDGQVVVDVGASTGGFTDCLLKHNAQRVYAVDVGYGQLAWQLRSDPRVVVLDRTNIRHLKVLPEEADGASIDVSFISLKLVLPRVCDLIKRGGWIVALIKPQFEAGRGNVGKGGVVRDPAVHRAVLHDLLHWAKTRDLVVEDLTISPILGPAGNREFLVLVRKPDSSEAALAQDESSIDELIARVG